MLNRLLFTALFFPYVIILTTMQVYYRLRVGREDAGSMWVYFRDVLCDVYYPDKPFAPADDEFTREILSRYVQDLRSYSL